LRVVIWNVLAPELLLYFWRSSYGLPLLADASAYDALTARRLSAVAATLRALAPDVVLLQETTDTAQAALGGATVAEYLAAQTGLSVAASSFKRARFRYGTPPREQPGPERAGGPPGATMDSGVATLVAPARVAVDAVLARAEDGGPSALFRGGVGSPFCSVRVRPRPGAGAGGGALTLVNAHVRMQFPRIAAPLAELLARAAPARGWADAVLAGDLNAGGREAAADLDHCLASVPLADAEGAAAPRADDHVLVGARVRVLAVRRCDDVPLLSMRANGGRPTADHRLWGDAATPYDVHAENAALVAGGRLTSDHPPLLVVLAAADDAS
jgi:hypothetical protein